MNETKSQSSPPAVRHCRLVRFDLVPYCYQLLYPGEHVVGEGIEHLEADLGVLLVETLDLVPELLILSQHLVQTVVSIVSPVNSHCFITILF